MEINFKLASVLLVLVLSASGTSVAAEEWTPGAAQNHADSAPLNSSAPLNDIDYNLLSERLAAWATLDTRETNAGDGAVAHHTGRYQLARSGNRFELGGGTRLTGWQVGDGLYFGRSKGDLKGVALVWQRSADQQFSLSDKGLRLTRRFR